MSNEDVSDGLLDPRAALDLAEAPVQNAFDFLTQARLLVDGGHFGRALTFAILGQEEYGKAFRLYCFAVDAYPGTKKSLKDIQFQHMRKQKWCLAPMLLSTSGMVPAILELVETELSSHELAQQDFDPERLSEYLECISGLLPNLEKRLSELLPQFAAVLPPLLARAEMFDARQVSQQSSAGYTSTSPRATVRSNGPETSPPKKRMMQPSLLSRSCRPRPITHSLAQGTPARSHS